MIFEIIVIGFLLFLTLLVLANKTFSPLLKGLFVLVFLMGMFFAHYPQRLDSVAQYLGVEAGSDLIFYLSTMLILYAVFIIYYKIRALNKRLESIDRHLAVKQASHGKGLNPDD